MNSSKQHQLFSLYNTILFTEVQAFSVLAFAYMWRSINILTKFDYTNEMAIDMNDSRNRISDYTRLFKKEMKIASNFIRRCDPFEDHEKGLKNFIINIYLYFIEIYNILGKILFIQVKHMMRLIIFGILL